MIFELLGTGIQAARSAGDLATILHIHRRDVSKYVEIERRAGKPICATSDHTRPGYFIPETRTEMERYCQQLQHRAGEIHKTRRACLKALDTLPGAPVID